jgi:hypothetical protein
MVALVEGIKSFVAGKALTFAVIGGGYAAIRSAVQVFQYSEEAKYWTVHYNPGNSTNIADSHIKAHKTPLFDSTFYKATFSDFTFYTIAFTATGAVLAGALITSAAPIAFTLTTASYALPLLAVTVSAIGTAFKNTGEARYEQALTLYAKSANEQGCAAFATQNDIVNAIKLVQNHANSPTSYYTALESLAQFGIVFNAYNAKSVALKLEESLSFEYQDEDGRTGGDEELSPSRSPSPRAIATRGANAGATGVAAAPADAVASSETGAVAKGDAEWQCLIASDGTSINGGGPLSGRAIASGGSDIATGADGGSAITNVGSRRPSTAGMSDHTDPVAASGMDGYDDRFESVSDADRRESSGNQIFSPSGRSSASSVVQSTGARVFDIVSAVSIVSFATNVYQRHDAKDAQHQVRKIIAENILKQVTTQCVPYVTEGENALNFLTLLWKCPEQLELTVDAQLHAILNNQCVASDAIVEDGILGSLQALVYY